MERVKFYHIFGCVFELTMTSSCARLMAFHCFEESASIVRKTKVAIKRTSVNTAKGLQPVRYRYFYNLQSITIHYLIFILRLTGEFTLFTVVILPSVTRTSR